MGQSDLWYAMEAEASSQDTREPWLPPRGMGSGRSSSRRYARNSLVVNVRNLDMEVTAKDLRSLFSKVGKVASTWVDAGSGTGSVEFLSAEAASQAVRRFHRHPWKGGRPMNVNSG